MSEDIQRNITAIEGCVLKIKTCIPKKVLLGTRVLGAR